MDKLATDPEVTSLFPLAGSPGTTVQAEIWGKRLDGAYAVWFSAAGLKADIRKLEEVDLEKKKEDVAEETEEAKKKEPEPGHRILLRFQIDPEARTGAYSLRVVSLRGVSNALTFWVHSDPVVSEIETLHDEPDQAQRVSVPVVINGRISKSGQLDSYEFEAVQGQELVFEHEGAGSSTLYEANGSWFDPHRVTRLDFVETEFITQILQSSELRLSYRFRKKGRYLLKVGGATPPDSSYLLRVAPIEDATPRGSTMRGVYGEILLTRPQWQEQNFIRRIGPDWLERLQSRGAADTSTATSTAIPTIVREQEQQGGEAQALPAVIPTLIEGSIDRPGDVDRFGFSVKAGQKLAFEIETPTEGPPLFNPRLEVLDRDGREVFNNIFNRIPSQSMIYWKSVQPKTIYTFDEEGEYVLQLRDITSRKGKPDFQYRVLIRPQIPHLGETYVAEIFSSVQLERTGYLTADRINLVPGEAKKLTVATSREEGFVGDIVVAVENLPTGVEAFPGTEVDPPIGGSQDKGRRERFQAEMQKATVILLAHETAPVTIMPHLIRISLRPIGEGRVGRHYKPAGEDFYRPVVLGQVGRLLPAKEIPLMVVRPPEPPPAQLAEKKR